MDTIQSVLVLPVCAEQHLDGNRFFDPFGDFSHFSLFNITRSKVLCLRWPAVTWLDIAVLWAAGEPTDSKIFLSCLPEYPNSKRPSAAGFTNLWWDY